MQTRELLKKVRKIEIKTRGLSSQVFSGEYHSAFKGRGMAFSEVREYTPGDEIRTIDWNVTARFNHPYVKVFEEERELTVILLIDVSASEHFASRNQLKSELAAEIAAVLSFSALQNNDKVGAILFSDTIEKFIPPKKGKTHLLHIISEILSIRPKSSCTDIAHALKFMNNAIKKRSIAFLVSDFYSPPFQDVLKITNRKHDLVALHLADLREEELPNMGIVNLQDPETGEYRWINTALKSVRKKFKAEALKRKDELKNMFRKSGVDYTLIYTHLPYTIPLMNLFKNRNK